MTDSRPRTHAAANQSSSGGCEAVVVADDAHDSPVPRSRLGRSARLGMRAGLEGASFAGAKASGVVRSKESRKERMDDVALHSAERLVETLGTMKGAAMKMGQLASFIDTDYLPD